MFRNSRSSRQCQLVKRFTRFFMFIFTIALIAILSFPASIGWAKPLAATMVTANDTAELITRINEANANSDDYVINLLNITYELTATNNNIDGNNGLPSILNNGSLTINGNGATIKRNSADQFRIWHIEDNASLILKDLALESGLIQGDAGTGGGGGGAGFGGAIFNRGNLSLEGSTVLNNQAIGGDGATDSGGTGGGFNAPADSGGTGDPGGLGTAGGDANGSNGGFGSGGGSGGTGGLGGGGNSNGGRGGKGGNAYGGAGGFGSGGGPGGTAGYGGGGGGGKGSSGAGEAGNTDGDGYGGDGGPGSSGPNNGAGGDGGNGGSADGGAGGFGGGGGSGGTAGTSGGGGGGGPNGNGGAPGRNGGNGQGAWVGGGGFAGSNGSANGGSGGYGAGNGSSTEGGGGGSFGGAIFNYQGIVVVTNTTFYSNTAQGGGGANGGSGYGGALFNYQGSMTATNNTLSHNIVQGDSAGSGGLQQGGAIFNYQGTLTLVNNILANSSGDNDCQNDSGTVTAPAGNGNLIESHSGCGTPAFTNDPNLNPLQDNGGLTHTMAPIFPSDVVDGGTDIGCPTTDQRGVSRPQRASCDIGAVEDELLGLSIDKKVTPTSAGPGETITYTISFNNTDTDTATGVVITDIIPISVTNVSVISQVDTAITDISATENYVWQVADLSQGQGGIITLTGQLSDTLAIGPTFTNTVSITTTATNVTIINTEAEATVDITCPMAFTVRNDNDSGDGSLRYAIGILCDGGTITFADNYSIYLDSTLTIAKGLTIDGSGKTVAISGDSNNDGSRNVRVFQVTASDVTLSYLNIVSGTGGIWNSGVLTVSNSTIVDNSTGEGGGIYNNNQLTVNNSTLSGNAATRGGAIFNNENRTATINNSTLVGNSASDGGAIYNKNSGLATPGGKVTINNSTLSGNSAGGSNSGAIYNGDGTTSGNADVTINNSTLANNSGGGVITFLNDRIILHNSIIANSTAGNDCDNSSGTVSANNNSLIEDGSCNPTFSGDPLLMTLGDYGGETQTMPLLPGSPAIDAGNDASCESTDQRGKSRFGTCDIGAFESQGFYLTITGGDNQSTPINNPFADQLAVTLVASDTNLTLDGGQTITFSAPGSAASLNTISFTTTTTSSGVASATVTANGTTGSYNVTATAGRGSNSAGFSLTNLDGADMAISKSVSAGTIGAGETITYTLSFTNIGALTATAGVITDYVPSNVTVQRVISSSDVAITHTSSTPTIEAFALAPLAPNEGGTITITAQVSSSLSLGTVFTNTATITTAVDSNPDNNNDAAGVEVTCLLNITVQNELDSGSGSLRQAIADICEGGLITFLADYTIYLSSTLTIDKHLTISGAGQTITISGDSGNDGSADVRAFEIQSNGIVTLSQLQIVDSIGSDGGGIANQGVLHLDRSLVTGNTATRWGGGIYNANLMTIANSTISDNTADALGGAIFNGGSQAMEIMNSTLYSNTAVNSGGAIHNRATITLTNVTIANNSASNIAGLHTWNGTAAVMNTLIANNSGSTNCGSAMTINTNNLIESGCSAMLTGDPLLSEPGNYGGDTATLALLPGSPAIDAGDPATCQTTDQRGQPRLGTCDIGAFESQGFSLSISGGNNQQTQINTAFAQALNLQVTANVITEPVGPGGVVSFTAPGSGAGLSQTTFTAAIDGSGAVSTTVSANGITGTYQVGATASGVSNGVDYALSNYTYYTLTTPLAGDGSGTVSLNPAGGVYTNGTVITLTATADAGSYFAGWSGDLSSPTNPISLTMDADKTITATFTAIPTYTLSVNVVGSGTVTPTSGSYLSGTVVPLSATPDAGWQFDGWGGDLSGVTNSVDVTMNSDKAITATFSLINNEQKIFLPLVLK